MKCFTLHGGPPDDGCYSFQFLSKFKQYDIHPPPTFHQRHTSHWSYEIFHGDLERLCNTESAIPGGQYFNVTLSTGGRSTRVSYAKARDLTLHLPLTRKNSSLFPASTSAYRSISMVISGGGYILSASLAVARPLLHSSLARPLFGEICQVKT